MARKKSLFSTIAIIAITSLLTLSVAGGAVAIRALTQNHQQEYVAKSIDKIEWTNTYGLIDEYTIYYTDGTNSKFIVANGAQGIQGIQGYPGEDGHTPEIKIGNNGNWYVDGRDTGILAQGPQGPAGQDGRSILSIEKTETNGLIDTYTITYSDNTTSKFIVVNGANGEQGIQGIPGNDGATPTVEIVNGEWVINNVPTGISATGPQGPAGQDGRSIVSIDLTNTAGLVDTYTIKYSDNTESTFIVVNGAQGVQGIQGMPGADGQTPTVEIGANGNWIINGIDTGKLAQGPQGPIGPQGPAGQDGRSIINIEKTASVGLVDTYTIYYSDNTTSTFVVTNGSDGSIGAQGLPGADGQTPVITVGANGNWFVDGVDTGTKAQGPAGSTPEIGPNGTWVIGGVDTGIQATGSDGTSVLTGNGVPNSSNGIIGDSYIDFATGDVYKKTDNGWEKQDGETGLAVPHIDQTSGHWMIGDHDTGVVAQGAAGQNGTSLHVDSGVPSQSFGNNGDSYIDKDHWDVYLKVNGEWVLQGNIQGAQGQQGVAGRGIASIAKTATNGLIDTYTITYTDGTTSEFQIVNGADGAQGAQGVSGNTPTIEINASGNWVIDGVDTGVKAQGNTGATGATGNGISAIIPVGTAGLETTYRVMFTDGSHYDFVVTNGAAGADGTSIRTGSGEPAANLGQVGDSYIDTNTFNFYVKTADGWEQRGNIQGATGATGATGAQGVSITSIAKTGTVGNVDTYTITFSNGSSTTFTVTNGVDGVAGAAGSKIILGIGAPNGTTVAQVGDTYIDSSTWTYYVKTDLGWDNYGSFQGATGANGSSITVSNVDKTTVGNVDTYTITFSDSTELVLTVTNGVNGTNGTNGTSVISASGVPAAGLGMDGDSYINIDNWDFYIKEAGVWVPHGNIKGDQGNTGTQGVSITSIVVLDDSNPAQTVYRINFSNSTYFDYTVLNGINGTNGTNGASVLTGTGAPTAQGDVGDSYIDTNTWNYYVKTGEGWQYKGNIKGVSIVSVVKTSTSGNVDTYTITYSDSSTSTFTVTNGVDGANGKTILTGSGAPDAGLGTDGDSYVDVSNWVYYVKTSGAWQNKGSFKGANGTNGSSVTITDISTSTSGNVDTYTITFSDSTVLALTVTNGVDGTNGNSLLTADYDPTTEGVNGDSWLNTSSWEYFVKEAGAWQSKGTIKGTNGTNGTSITVGTGAPTSEAQIGDSYIDTDTWDLYVYTSTGWGTPIGNIHTSPNVYTVTFDSDGGNAISPITDAREGQTISAPAVPPLKAGWIFQGWYTAEGNKWNFEKDVVTGNITLHAHWAKFLVIDGVLVSCTATGAVVIPEFFDGQLITAIDPTCFAGNDQITSITLPHTITSISDYSFEDCTNLKEIYLPDGFQSIGNGAFNGCTSLTSIVIPYSVKTIGESAFEDCTQLKYVYLSSTPSRNNSSEGLVIGEKAFKNCTSLESLVIPNSVKHIGACAFEGCDNLKSLTISADSWAGVLEKGHGEPQASYGNDGDWYLDLDSGYVYGRYSGNWVYLIPAAFNFGHGAPANDAYSVDDLYLDLDTFEYYQKASADSWTRYGVLTNTSGSLVGLFGANNPSEVTSLENLTITGGASIYPDAFASMPNLKTVTLGDSITRIYDSAFEGCTSLETVTLSKNLIYIDEEAFKNCTSLTSVVIPAGVTSVGERAFQNCTSLSALVITNGASITIGREAFDNCTSLQSISIPSRVTSIGYGAFNGCTGLITVSFQEGTGSTEIEDRAFEGCTNIETLVLSNCVTSIGMMSFESCKITSLVIPDSVTSIGAFAFNNCDQLAVVYLGNGLTEIGNYAFHKTQLENVVVPESVTALHIGAFGDCNSLTSITLPYAWAGNGQNESIQYIFHHGVAPSYSWELPTSLKTIVIIGNAAIGDDAFDGCGGITTFVIRDNPGIAKGALDGLTGLQSLTINTFKFDGTSSGGASSYTFYKYGNGTPDPSDTSCSVYLDLDTGVFYENDGGGWAQCTMAGPDDYFEEVAYGVSAHQIQLIEGAPNGSTPTSPNIVMDCASTAIYDWDGDEWQNLGFTMLSFVSVTPSGGGSVSTDYYLGYLFGADDFDTQDGYLPTTLTSVTVTGGDTDYTIPAGALANCSNIKTVTFGDKVIRIGNNAFKDCTSLTTINLPNELQTIGDNAFDGCSSVTSLVIPDSVTHIGVGALHGMTSLSTLATPFIGTGKGAGDHQAMIYLFVPDLSASLEGHHYQSSLKTIIITQEVGNSIPDGAFMYCEYLENISIPSGYTTIEIGAFAGTKLKSFIVPEGVTSIGNSAFASCSSLVSVSLPKSLLTIGNNAFYKDSSLASIVIPANVTAIGVRAFQESGIVSLVIQEGSHKTIDDHAFYLCHDLKYASIQGNTDFTSTTSNKYGYFASCENLEYVYLGSGFTSIPEDTFHGCTSLKSIIIPEGVTDIGDSAFFGCSSLSSVVLPESLVAIWEHAFEYSGLKNLVIPANVTDIGLQAFAECTELETLFVKDGSPISIGDSAFAYDTKLKTVIIESALAYVDDYEPDELFRDCSALEYVSLGEGTTFISEMMFAYCHSLKTVVLPSTITKINKFAFYDTAIESIVLPNSLKKIDEQAFAYCGCLTYVYMPEGLENICDGAFAYCNGWKHVLDVSVGTSNPTTQTTKFYINTSTGKFYINIGVSTWQEYNETTYFGEFATDPRQSTAPVGIQAGDYYFHKDATHNDLYVYVGKGLTSIVIPTSVQNIGRLAFGGNYNLASISLPFVGGAANGYGNIDVGINVSAYGFVPNANAGNDNDFYLDANRSALWRKIDGVWYKQVIIGIPNHEDQSATFNYGTIDPVGAAPDNVHYHINTATGHFWLNNSGTWQDRGKLLDEFSDLDFAFGNAELSHFGEFNNELPATLKTVVITGDGAIPANALKNASHIETVIISGNTSSIGFGAFQGCNSLKSITLPYIGGAQDDGTQYGGSTLYFAYIFGGSKWDGSDPLYNSGVPSSLKSVTLTAVNSLVYDPGDQDSRFTCICDYAFAKCANIENITLPNSCTFIVSNAFNGCSSLKSIVIPNDCVFVGDYAFANCSSLKYAYIPEQITPFVYFGYSTIAIGNSAFENCTSIESIVIPHSVDSLGHNAFKGCSSLTMLTMPALDNYLGVFDYQNNPFTPGADDPRNTDTAKHYWLNTVTGDFWVSYYGLGDWDKIYDNPYGGAVSYGENAPTGSASNGDAYYRVKFDYFNGIDIKELYVYDGTAWRLTANLSYTYLPYYFGDDDSLVPDSLKTVVITAEDGSAPVTYGNMFKGCEHIENIVLPNNMVVIGANAFNGCSSLKSFTIPQGIVSIGSNAFKDCSCFNSVAIPNSVKLVGDNAFSGCTNVEYIYFEEGSVLSTIGEKAFDSCVNVKHIVIPDSVTSIGKGAFQPGKAWVLNTSYVNPITSGIGAPTIAGSDGNLYADTSNDKVYVYTGGDWMNLPMFAAGSGAPSDSINLDIYAGYVDYTNGVLYMLGYHSVLESITLPFIGDSPTGSKQFFTHVFGGDYSSNSEFVPTSLKTAILTGLNGADRNVVPDSAFFGIRTIENVILPASPNDDIVVESSAFARCSSLKAITIEGVASIGERAFEDDASLKSVYLKGVSSIGQEAFVGCNELTDVTVIAGASNRVDISDKAFKQCISLAYFNCNSINSVGTYAFYQCTSLKQIRIPYSVTLIGFRAFEECSSLETLEFFDSGLAAVPITIKERAFYQCTSLKNIYFNSANIVRMEDLAFSRCTSLTSIVVPETVSFLGACVFDHCTSLKEATITNKNYSFYNPYLFGHCTSLEKLTIPYIGDSNVPTNATTAKLWYMFGEHKEDMPSSLKTLVVLYGSGASYDTILEGALSDCKYLETVILGDGIKYIEDNAFQNCYRLKTLELPSTLVSIGNGAFQNCNWLTDVYFTGTSVEWTAITIGSDNDRLTGANIRTF